MTTMAPMYSYLHTLVQVENWPEAEKLLAQDPSLAHQVGGAFQTLPLLEALLHRPPLSFVQALIKANPSALSATNDLHMLPLRTAIRNKASTDVILALIEAYPDATKSVGVTGKTCLHLACMYQQAKKTTTTTTTTDLTVVERLLQVWPEAASQRDHDGWYPLHLACLCQGSEELIEAIVQAYPEATKLTCTQDEELPLHLAALHGATVPTLRLLYKSFPEGIDIRTKTHGWTALHLACCRSDVSVETIQALLDMNPSAAKIPGKICGSLPLHIAARNNCSTAVLELLWQAYPEAMQTKTYAGDTPGTCGRGNVQQVIQHMTMAS